MKYLKAVLALLIFNVCCSQSNEPIVVTKENLLNDLPALKEKILTTHPNPFYLTTQEDFEAKFNSINENAATLNADQLFVKMLEITASIGDGHTNLRPFAYYNQYPIRFYWLGEKIYISGATADHQDLLGSVLVKVNDTPIDVVTTKLFKLIPGHETLVFSEDWATFYLTISQIMYGLSVTPTDQSIAYSLETPSGETTTLTLNLPAPDEEVEIIRPYKLEPAYYEAKENGLWFSEWEHNLVYFHFSSYPSRSTFKDVANDLKKFLETSEDKTLLIDLRRNGGGDFTKGRKLLSMIEGTIKKKQIPVYVAIGRDTYSAAVTNATDFKSSLNATLIGEVTAGRPNGYQENNPFVLPNSKIPGSVSSEYYKFQEEDTPGVFPDVEIPFRWKEYANAEDPVIAYLYDLLK